MKRYGLVLITLLWLAVFVSPAYAKGPCLSAKGSPVWSVNRINLNLYVKDIPLWYTPQIGPRVEISLNYNSQSAEGQSSAFGDKWQFNYQSFLTEDAGSGEITVTMPDGKEDVFTPDGQGGYTKLPGVFNILTKTGTDHFELKFTDDAIYVYTIPANTTLTNPVITELRDAYGQKLTFGYNASNQLATITDAQNRVTTIQYTGSHITSVTDPFGRTASFGYTGDELTSITDMGGYVSEIGYTTSAADNRVYISSISNKGIGGLSTPKTWTFYVEPDDGIDNNSNPYPAPGGAMNNLYRITVTDPLGGKEEYYYYGPYTWYVSPNDYVEYVDADTNNYKTAKKTLYYLDRTDPKGRVSKIEGPEGGYTEYSDFDAATNQPRTISHYHGTDAADDPIIHSVLYTYNQSGMTTSIKDAKEHMTNIVYYPNNVDVQSITNGLGSISYTWNSTHDVTSITDRINVTTAMTYNAYGQLETITQAQGTAVQTVTEMTYDPTAKTLTNIKKNGNVLTIFTYDPIGRVQTTTDAKGFTLDYDYDNLDRLTVTTYPDTKTSIVSYSDCCVRMVESVTERSGLKTTYTHDALKRITKIDGPGGIYEFEYDKNGNQKKLIDKNRTPQVETLFDYGLDNRLTKKTYADGKYWTYDYDKMGLLKSFTNARNITKTLSYDANHNLTNIDYSDDTPDVSFTPDDYDRVGTRTDGSGSYSYTYYANNSLHTVDGPLANDLITYDYDELGRIKSLTAQGGQTVNYGYDSSAGRLQTVQTGTDTFTYGYSGVNPLIESLTRPNGSYTEYQYNDPLKRLTDVINKTDVGAIINQFSYTYNDHDLKGTETITNGEAIDNFIAGSTNYTPNNLNQVTGSTNPERTYVYDFDGNLTDSYSADGYRLYMTYDAENRMKSAEYEEAASGQQSAVIHRTEYFYSGDSLLSEVKKYENGLLVTDRRYVRAGFLPIQERDGNNVVVREYTWDRNYPGGISGLLNLKQNGLNYAYLYDGKGNVTALIDDNQALSAAYAYDPFGRRMKRYGVLDQPFQFSTKEYDPETGLSYYGYRFYNPEVGKWTTRDPLGEKADINLYRSMGNNVVNFVDPEGKSHALLPVEVTAEILLGSHGTCLDDGECALSGSHYDGTYTWCYYECSNKDVSIGQWNNATCVPSFNCKVNPTDSHCVGLGIK